MAYIIKRKNREGKFYVYLVESYRKDGKPKQRTLKSYGQLDALEEKEPGAFDKLVELAKAGKLTEDASKELNITLNLNEIINDDHKNYGWMILDEVFNKLDIDEVIKNFTKNKKLKYDLNNLLKLLVFQRILNPCSKSKTLTLQKKMTGLWNFNSNEMDRGLDNLYLLTDEIQMKIHSSISKNIGRTGYLVFYDVTNYFFETDIVEDGQMRPEGLKRRGPSKEHRPNPIVQMGLFMDENGIPISFMLFPGNNTDPTTYIPAIEKMKKLYGIQRIITVADKAMNSNKNICETLSNEDGWLFSQKHRGTRGAPKDIQKFILEEGTWLYNKSATFALKSTIRERQITLTDESGKKTKTTVKEKVVVTWNQKYANREKERRKSAIRYIQGLLQPQRYIMSCKKGGKKYLDLYVIDKETKEKKLLTPFIDINYESVEFDAQFDGINVLVTSELNMSDEEIIEAYGELYQIEDCFRVTKTDLESRPVYVWTKEHITAHFLTCFIALVIIRIIQHKVKHEISVNKIVDGLREAICITLAKGYYRVDANENLIQLNKLLNIKWDKKNVKEEELKNYGVGWFTTQ